MNVRNAEKRMLSSCSLDSLSHLEISDSVLLGHSLRAFDLGKIEYQDAWQLQKKIHAMRVSDQIEDTLLFCEHPAVITVGRSAHRPGADSGLKALRPAHIPVLEIERGGFATYHGPGQIVVYPIFRMDRKESIGARRGVHGLLRGLENWVVALLQKRGLDAGIIDGKTGVWIGGERKIASIGIAAKHWVSYHGIALNLSTGPEPWQWLNPCGFGSNVMTDMKAEELNSYDYATVRNELISLTDALIL